MAIVKTKVAEALSPMLSGFHSVSGQSLRSIKQVFTEGSLDRFILDFGPKSLVVIADEDDDSIDVELMNTCDLHIVDGIDASQMEPWKDFIGKSLGWGWITVNQQGYCDGVLLSFGGIVPQVMLNVAASSIKAGVIVGVAGPIFSDPQAR